MFPKENLVASSKRLKNLGELLSPTVQPAKAREAEGDDGPQAPSQRQGGVSPPIRGRGRGGGSGRGRTAPARGQNATEEPASSTNGTYYCSYQKSSGKCDVCGHMVESRNVFSSHFKVKHAIAGRNIHLPSTWKIKLRWFVYLEECVHPDGIFQYVGSTNSMTQRWSNTKSVINSMQFVTMCSQAQDWKTISREAAPSIEDQTLTMSGYLFLST